MNKNEITKCNKIQSLLLVEVKTSTRKNITQVFLWQLRSSCYSCTAIVRSLHGTCPFTVFL